MKESKILKKFNFFLIFLRKSRNLENFFLHFPEKRNSRILYKSIKIFLYSLKTEILARTIIFFYILSRQKL